MDNIVLDRSGNLVSGYFYELAVLQDESHLSLEHSKTPEVDVISLRRPTNAELRKSKSASYLAAKVDKVNGTDKEYDCPVDNAHETAVYWKNITIELSGGPRY